MIQWTPLPFVACDRDRLLRSAITVLPPGAPVPAGRSEERTLSFLAGRAAIARLFGEVGFPGFVAPDPRFGFLRAMSPDGTPAVDLHVNVSHTTGIAVAAVSRRPVGVDVEHRDRDATRAISRVSTARERAQAPGAVALWSSKEAISKATGLGIKFGMRAFRPDFTAKPPFPVALDLFGPLPLVDPAVRLISEGLWVVALCGERRELLSVPHRVSG